MLYIHKRLWYNTFIKFRHGVGIFNTGVIMQDSCFIKPRVYQACGPVSGWPRRTVRVPSCHFEGRLEFFSYHVGSRYGVIISHMYSGKYRAVVYDLLDASSWSVFVRRYNARKPEWLVTGRHADLLLV